MFGLVSIEFLFYMLILFFRIRATQQPHAVSVLPHLQGGIQAVFQQRRRGSRLSFRSPGETGRVMAMQGLRCAEKQYDRACYRQVCAGTLADEAGRFTNQGSGRRILLRK